MKPSILIVEDEPAITEMLRYNLEAEGFQVADTADGERGLEMVEEERPDLLLLDWMLPGVSGIEICRRLRARAATRGLPIIMLTARGEESDRIRGLDCGADDYVTKPFSPAELIARVNAVLRRLRPALAGEILSCYGLTLDPVGHRVARADRPIALSPTEFRLLRHLMEQPRRVFSREQLLDAVWGRDSDVESRTVDVHVRRLRRALNAGDLPDLIRTVRSAGYALDASE